MQILDENAGLEAALESREALEDPYPLFRRFLDRPGWQTPSGYLVFSRYADVMTILRDPATFGQEPLPYPNFHVTDPPDHTRVRRLVARAFGPRAVKQQNDKIAGWVDALVDDLIEAGSMDFVPDFARRLSATVISDLLGVPMEDSHLWYRWMDDVHVLRGYIQYFPRPQENAEAETVAGAAAAAIANYFAELIASRKDTGDDSLVSGLIEAREENDQLSEDDILYALVLLLGAGLGTTANQLGNTLRALIDHPEAWAALRRDPSLASNVVEEALRFNGTAQSEYRIAQTNSVVGGVPVEAGQPLIILMAAANRDPAMFDQPEVFDIRRKNAHQHLGFGFGIHHCLGAYLARAELVPVFGTLARRVETITFDGTPTYYPYNKLRGHAALPIRCTAAAGPSR
jgi:cytochrome P450